MKITCLVDNSVQAGSALWGEHGLSFLIQVHGKQLLFDTGSSGTVLEHNLQEIGLQPGSIAALVLSHAHRDHTGGLGAILELQPGPAL
jgi:7,8-dihydropterin-6-yl-methyl-4-(beta-D-ribofuranosyl)aminobenzene 5'-phosphate synthase